MTHKQDIARIKKTLESDLGPELMQTVALAVDESLKINTPIETGWLRSNWIPSVGTPSNVLVGSKKGVDFGPQQQGLGEVLTYRDLSQSIFFTNRVPYALFQNDGTSKFPPRMFTEKATVAAAKASKEFANKKFNL